MPAIHVIADDFTGAAEIAAIALEHGLDVSLLREAAKPAGTGTIVFDTDTRTAGIADAAVKAARFARAISPSHIVYKKIDSVLRGPVLVEAKAILKARGLSRGLIVPQNPQKGRTILDGQYRIDGIALSQTSFATDPLHPIQSSDVLQLLGTLPESPVEYSPPGGKVSPTGFTVGGGSTSTDLAHWAKSLDPQTLPIGGAEFFAAVLQNLGYSPKPTPAAKIAGSMLLVSGSSANSLAMGLKSALPMPDGLGSDASAMQSWRREIQHRLASQGLAIVRAPATRHRYPLLVSRVLAKAVSNQLAIGRPDWLVIEGGQTASEILIALGWNRFEVLGQLGPGVAQLRPMDGDGPGLVVKPGSYPWPPTLREILDRA